MPRILHLCVALILVVALTGCSTPWFTLEWAPVDLSQPRAHTASTVLGVDGSPIGSMQISRHEPITREQIPDLMVAAITSAEDRRFFEHNGIDLRGIARAFKANQEEGKVVQGGSTITQQLVKNLYLDASDKTLSRKAREANMAMKLEELKTKDEILTDYCNSVYLGSGSYGMQAGSQTYFGKPLSALSLDQIALLVGILRRPEGANPFTNADGALSERHRVLVAMKDVGHIDEAAFATADSSPLALIAPQKGPTQAYPYIMEAIRRQIVDSGVLGWSEEDTMNRLFSNGYTIHTTINPRMQQAAQRASTRYLSGNEPESAIVLMDPTNGHIRAMVGGRDFEQSQFNLATQGRRQPGSVFKVFGLAAALEGGMKAEQTYDAGPGEATVAGEKWAFKSAQPPGNMNLADGLVISSNGVYARLALDIGGQAIANMASTLGVGTPQAANPANVLGGADPGVTVQEMATAFSTLANHGIKHEPVLVTSITDQHGNELYSPVITGQQPDNQQVISAQTADAVSSIMERVITEGTGKQAAIGRPAAGKTGTVNDNTDAWFVGYTPDLVGAVWVGYPNERKPMNIKGFGLVQGGNLPAAIWASAMSAALSGSPPQPFNYTTSTSTQVIPAPAVAASTPTPTPTSAKTPAPVTTPAPAPTNPVTPTQSPSPYRPEPVLAPRLPGATTPVRPAPAPPVQPAPVPLPSTAPSPPAGQPQVPGAPSADAGAQPTQPSDQPSPA